MRNILQKVVCWLIKHTQNAVIIDGIRFYDLRFGEDGRTVELVRHASDYLRRADPRFRTLVLGQVRMLVASSFQQSIYLATGAYFTQFTGWEGRNPLFLASRLVWIAEYRRRVTSREDDVALGDACTSMQLAFLDSIGEEPDWLASFRRNAGILSDPPTPE
jgi:hypothetical protein